MFALNLASVTVALGLAASSVAQLPKPVLFSDGLSPHVDATFMANIQPQNITSLVSRTWGTLPEACLDYAHGAGLKGWDIEVYEVTYSDCDTPWVFCRHHEAQLSQFTMGQLFGRLPVHERQWVRHVMAVPGGGSAYAVNADVVFEGNTDAVSIFQHEVGHLVDAYNNGFSANESPAFRAAVAADTCVPDDYSNSSFAEDYTQVSVLALYDIVAPGGLNSTGANWSCLANQKAAVDTLQRNAMTFGGKCDRRWSDSPSVEAQLRRGRRTAMPRGELDPPPYRSDRTFFKNIVHQFPAAN
ncbi:hypothetical protein BKA62DRAFT_668832 [Auriculariales sp. MPI-PUGE-AT-0066]|nr:hypothetical protein BKA62DRAFT_668832 [Auriculariales sp. MPI-PUGE-AT-0066]